MNTLAEIAAYCAANIEDWDIKCGMALRHIGRRMPIDYGFRNEIEDCVSDWAKDNGFSVNEFDESAIDVEEIIFAESDVK